MRALTATLLLVMLIAPARAQKDADSPEPAILALIKAIYANDPAAYNKVTVDHPRRALLTAGGRPNTARLMELAQAPGSLQMKNRRSFLYRGLAATVDASGHYPVGTTALYSVVHSGNQMVAPLVRQEDGWKVDVRWWLAMMDLQKGPEPRNSPAFAARALTASMAAMDRDSAAKFATPGAGTLEVLFRGAQREPSGMFDALAMEMPLVELQPGEFFPIDDKVVEGSSAPDQKLLLGLFGVVEIPFVVRRISNEWRVEPQPFYRYFNR